MNDPQKSPDVPQEEPEVGGVGLDEDLAAARGRLEEQLAKVTTEAAELKDRWLRAAADLENYRRRAVKEREEIQKFAAERLLRDLLPVVDDLDRALESVAHEPGTEAQLRDGVELVRKKFIQQLEKHGVEAFSSRGEVFDPAMHDAIQQAHSDDVEAGRVLQELQRGFRLNDRLLRPATVVVSLGPERAG